MSQSRRNRRKSDTRNQAGFKKGDEGVYLDKHGNRRIYEISLTPDGQVISRFGAHPAQIVSVFQQLMKENVQSRQMILLSAQRYKKENRFKELLSRFKYFLVRLFTSKKKLFQSLNNQPKKEK